MTCTMYSMRLCTCTIYCNVCNSYYTPFRALIMYTNQGISIIPNGRAQGIIDIPECEYALEGMYMYVYMYTK